LPGLSAVFVCGECVAVIAGRYMLIIRLLALLAVLWTGKQVVKQVAAKLHPERAGSDQSEPQKIEDDMVKDPMCSTYIPKSLARHKELDGQDYYFCSDECVTKFMEQHSVSPEA
jgi:YHS domain-containing protein